MSSNGRFTFTVADAARFLGKSAVTLRQWERQGLVSFSRDTGGDRKLGCAEMRTLAQEARRLGRISTRRQRLVESAITLLDVIEGENK